MGLCKCPKRKVTNQFCFEHRVNVCEHCMVAAHANCVVQSYLAWLQVNQACNIREATHQNWLNLGKLSQMRVGGVAEPLKKKKITPKISFLYPKFTFRFPKSHINPGVGSHIWEYFGGGFPYGRESKERGRANGKSSERRRRRGR